MSPQNKRILFNITARVNHTEKQTTRTGTENGLYSQDGQWVAPHEPAAAQLRQLVEVDLQSAQIRQRPERVRVESADSVAIPERSE